MQNYASEGFKEQGNVLIGKPEEFAFVPFGYPWTKKVNLRLQPWTSRPRAQIVFVSRYRGPWRANARTLLIRTSALMSA